MRETTKRKESRHAFALLLALFFMLFASGQMYAQSGGNPVSVNCEKESLATVLKTIEKKSDVKIMFTFEEVKPYHVTMSVSNVTAEQAVKKALEGTPLTYRVRQGKNVVIMVSKNATSKLQPNKRPGFHTVRGKVVDNNAEPLINVTVMLNETKRGTITDANGEFLLYVADNKPDRLTFRYLGMSNVEKRVAAGKDDVDYGRIVMNDDKSVLSEVVVTGVFNKPKESYTGAATSFTHKQLEEAGSRSLISSLQNMDPSFNIADNISIGSNPNSLPNITMRGASSLPTDVQDLQTSTENMRTANQPLFILDGFEITLTQFMDLDESQVGTITLLKDASSTALYGSKGSNGVVVITSKNITPGKLRINYKGTLSIEAPDLTSYNLMNSREKLMYEKAAGLYDSSNAISDLELKDVYNARKLDVERGVDTYWLKYPVRTGVGSRHSLSVDGGNDNLRYNASISYNDVEGAMKGSNRKTLNGEMFLLYKHKNWTFQNRLSIIDSKSNDSPYGDFSQYCLLNAYYSPYDADGNIQKVLEDRYYISTGRRNTVYNPLYDAYLPQKNSSQYTSITNNFALEWHILPELFVRGQFSYTKTTNRSDKYICADNTMFDSYIDDDYNRKGRYTYGTGNAHQMSGQLTLNYTKDFADVHQIFAGLGFTFDESKSESYSVVGEGISVLNMDFLGMANQYLKDSRPSGSESLSRDFGMLFNFRYTYDSRYFVDLNGKYDGSSQFGTNNHFAPFWSTGLGWNMQNEKWLKGNKYINIARLKASYGITGSQNFASYLSLRTYKDNTGKNTNGWTGVSLMAYGNPDLKWQKTRQLNVGTELALFQNNLNISMDVYNKVTDNLLTDINLPLSSGFASYKANVGKVENRGWELYVNGTVLKSRDNSFRWKVGMNMVHNVNRIKEISNSLKALNDELSSTTSYNPSFMYKEGESMNTIYAVKSKGIDPSNGKEIFVKTDGTETYTWDSKDQVACGTTDPKVQGNFNTNVYWKGFSLNMIFGYRWGGHAYNTALANKVENIYPYQNADRRALYNRWKQPGDVADFKSVEDVTKTYATSRFVFKDNTFYGSSLSLSYEMPRKWISHIGLDYLKLTADTEDLFYMSTIKRERGTSYPFSRKFSFSLTARF